MNQFSKLNLVGKRFGRLIVTGRMSEKNSEGRRLWNTLCDCGGTKLVPTSSLVGGRTKSCGCWQKTKCHRHGHAGGRGILSPTYRSWVAMRSRCQNPRRRSFKDYGKRGIVVCSRWSDFINFLADMGERPAGRSLDRIDTNGNYTPENCRWATRQEQVLNRRPRKCLSDYTTEELKAEIARRNLYAEV